MSESASIIRRQFSLLNFLIGISFLLVTFYANWRWNIPELTHKSSKPPQLEIIGSGGLHRWRDTFFIFPAEPFEGGLLVLKNNGLINSFPVSFPAKGGFSIEQIGNGIMKLYCAKFPQGIVLLDLETELKQATSAQWGDTDRGQIFSNNENEWGYFERSLDLNGAIDTYKIIICQSEKKALSKYSNYSPNTHPGKPSIKSEVNSE